MCFLFIFSTNLMAQCESSPTACQPQAGGHGPDPCDAKIYCSNSGSVEHGLIACTTAADTDGCGVEASLTSFFTDPSLFIAEGVPVDCYSEGGTNYTHVQWIKFATPPNINTVKLQGVGQMTSWVVFHAGSELNDGNLELLGCDDLTYVDGACSDMNQWKVWTNSDAVIDDDFVNVYYIALFYDDTSNGSINFKVKECEFILTCEPEITCPEPSACLTTQQQVIDWYNDVSYGGCGQAVMVSAIPSIADVGECTSTVVFTLVDPDGNPIVHNGVIVKCTTSVNIDMTDPEIVDVDDYTLTGCNTPWPANLATSWTDNCTGGGNLNSDAGVDGTTSGCIQTRVYTFTVTDDCGNSDTETTTLSRKYNMTAPVILDVDDYTLTGCNTPWPANLATSWTDNCSGGGNLNSDAGVDGTTSGCIQTRVYSFTVTDDCGNSDSETTTLSRLYVDNLTCNIEVNPTNDCSGIDVTLDAVSDTGCGDLPAGYSYAYSWSNGATTSSITVGAGTYTVDISIIDPTGNSNATCSTSCDYTISEECETSWAKASNSLCFNELGGEGCNNANNLPWGFTTPVTIGQTYTFDLLEGAPGQCANNGSLGDDVGDVTITWDGNTPVININTNDGEHYLQEVHVWIGCNPLPKKGKKCKSVPGQLGCTYENINSTNFLIDGSNNICNGNTSCDQIWIAIHAVTCDLKCENESFNNTDIETSFIQNDKTEIQISKMNINTFDYLIYPNPLEGGKLDIAMNILDENEVFIRIFNIQGVLIHQKSLQAVEGENKYSFDMQNFDNGIYFLNIQNGEDVITKRFIKNDR